jgi:hypothetical protein
MKNSRGRQNVILGMSGVAAIVAIALWLRFEREVPPRPPAAAHAVAPAQPKAATVSPPSVAAPVPSSPVTATAAPTPASPSSATILTPTAVPKAQSAPAPEAEVAAPAEAAATEANPEAPMMAQESNDKMVDASRAIDLFAEQITRLEQEDSDAEDAVAARLLQQFDARDEGQASSEQLEQTLRRHLDEWVAAMPQERQQHVAVVAVDCRVGACRVLIAENPVDFSAMPPGGESPIESFQRSFNTLKDEPWWPQLGLSLTSISAAPADGDLKDTPGYALWTIYLDVASAQ